MDIHPDDQQPSECSPPEEEAFTLTVSTLALESLLALNGVRYVTQELRQSVVDALKDDAPQWLEQLVSREATRIQGSN